METCKKCGGEDLFREEITTQITPGVYSHDPLELEDISFRIIVTFCQACRNLTINTNAPLCISSAYIQGYRSAHQLVKEVIKDVYGEPL